MDRTEQQPGSRPKRKCQDEDDEHATPTHSTSDRVMPPKMPFSPLPPYRDPSTRMSSGQRSDTAMSDSSSTMSKNRARPGPEQELALREHAPCPIRRRTLQGLQEGAVPEEVYVPAAKMRRISRNQGILSRDEDTESMRRTIGSQDEDEDDELFASVFADDRASLGTAPTLETVEALVEESEFHRINSASEAAWNCALHYPMVSLARRHSKWSGRWRWDNITATAISPTSLLHLLGRSGGEVAQGKQVDLCLSADLGDDVTARLVQAEVQLNPTDYLPLIRRAIAVSIVTTTADSGEDEAKLQLSTWAFAQITRLRQLLQQCGNAAVQIPALPLIIVRGHEWTFYCMRDREGRCVDFYDEGIEIGSTSSVLGC